MSIKNFFKSKFAGGKASKFFEREGFYIVLFLCVCIVAITAVWVSRTGVKKDDNMSGTDENKTTVETPAEETPSKETSNWEETEEADIPIVEETEVSKEEKEVEEDEKESESSTGKSAETPALVKFASPLEESIKSQDIVEDYSPEEPVFYEYLDTWMTHCGMDIKTSEGEEVLAVYGGKVVEAVNDNEGITGLGWKVVIDHNNGFKSVYANLNEKLAVKVGDTVKKGQKIGVVGKTSAFERPIAENMEGISHLHFELLKKGAKSYENVDPNKYLPVQK